MGTGRTRRRKKKEDFPDGKRKLQTEDIYCTVFVKSTELLNRN
jgi:hypothetical protein